MQACPECGHQVSSAASSCPQCGAPVTKVKASTRFAGYLLLLLFLGGLWMFFGIRDRPGLGSSNVVENPPLPRCNVEGARAVVGKLQAAGVVTRIDQSTRIPKIYIGWRWYQAQIDAKEGFDIALQCWLGDGKAPVLAVYRDDRTGKNVATSGKYGFRME